MASKDSFSVVVKRAKIFSPTVSFVSWTTLRSSEAKRAVVASVAL
jgi:hypothetical protein